MSVFITREISEGSGKREFYHSRWQTVALVGPSGAGKTTLAQLLMRFWDPSEGTILLSGNDIREYGLEALRSKIALVAQDTYLFNSTLKENILIAKPDASYPEMKKAIQMASLTELVETLPQGFDTKVGERGTSLSGGKGKGLPSQEPF